jgi:methyl-accepting chemotaxis protein
MKTVRGTLRAGFVLLFAVLTAQGIIAWLYLDASKHDVATSVQQNFAASTQLAELAVLGQSLRRYEKEYFIFLNDPKKRDDYASEWAKTYEKIFLGYESIKTNRSGIWTARDRAEVASWYQSVLAYEEGIYAVRRKVELQQITTAQEANHAIREAKDKFRVHLQGTVEMLKRKHAESQELAAKVGSRLDFILLTSALLSLAAVALLVAIAVLVPRSIEAPIDALAEAARSMSNGNFEQPFKLTSRLQEFRMLADHLERMRVVQKSLLNTVTRRNTAARSGA